MLSVEKIISIITNTTLTFPNLFDLIGSIIPSKLVDNYIYNILINILLISVPTITIAILYFSKSNAGSYLSKLFNILPNNNEDQYRSLVYNSLINIPFFILNIIYWVFFASSKKDNDNALLTDKIDTSLNKFQKIQFNGIYLSLSIIMNLIMFSMSELTRKFIVI